MSLSLIAFIKAVILPPTLNFILIILGLSIIKKNKFLSYMFLFIGVFTLLLFCLSPFSNFLLHNLEKYPALELPIEINNEQAIVILSAGSYPLREEYNEEINGANTLQRIHYGAFLYKQLKLPVLVTGGLFEPRLNSEAAVMADTLKNNFNVEVNWLEEQAKNTAENAFYSVEMLKQSGIDSIYLVTHAWHMSRAVMMFEQEGINVTPAPTMFMDDVEKPGWSHYVPSASALSNSSKALHEYIGIFWYKIRY
ncbi:MAG TPA: YdcF family protein [Thiotrichaceae bacterium]|jgi:uncharacterized SAM-binding protein YcdF (DUF218 family)|nr:YdcF family protein [Thiotrichaceae bacterium]